MLAYLRDGTLLGGEPWKLLLALALMAVGAWLVGCGVNVCWSRAARRESGRRPRHW